MQSITLKFEGIDQEITVPNLYKFPSLGELVIFRTKEYRVLQVKHWILSNEPFNEIAMYVYLNSCDKETEHGIAIRKAL